MYLYGHANKARCCRCPRVPGVIYKEMLNYMHTNRFSFWFVFFSYSLLSFLLVVSASCESQWTSFGSSCYKLHTLSKDWENAKKSCQNFGAQLVKIETEEENQFIITTYFSYINFGRYWIGLSDLGNEGKWKWTDGTGLTSYTNWGEGQPNNHRNNQHCGAIIKGHYRSLHFNAEWNDDICSLHRGYICEK